MLLISGLLSGTPHLAENSPSNKVHEEVYDQPLQNLCYCNRNAASHSMKGQSCDLSEHGLAWEGVGQ